MIIIEGVSGVGKSTLQKKICERIKNSLMLVQDYEHNICLKDYYNGEPCTLQKEMIFLFSDYHLLQTSLKKNDGKIIVSDFSLERSQIMAKHYLSEFEYNNLFLPCYEYITKQISTLNKTLILLYASPEYVLNNIKKRNRIMEKTVSLQQINMNQKLINDNLSTYDFEKIVKIDCTQNNILDDLFIEQLIKDIAIH